MDVPKVFGWQHLTFLAIFLIFCAGLIVLFKYKIMGNERRERIFLRACGGVLLFLIIWNRISISVFRDNWFRLFPDSLCGVTSLGLGICACILKRDALPFHFLVYVALFGGATNIIYPYYVSQSPDFLLPATMSGLLHHGFAMLLAILLIMSGYFRPSLKKYYAMPIGFCITMVYGIFLVDALGKNSVGELGFDTAMNIYSPLVSGTFFYWYVVFPLACLLVLGVLLVYEKVILPRRAAKNTPDEPAQIEPTDSTETTSQS